MWLVRSFKKEFMQVISQQYIIVECWPDCMFVAEENIFEDPLLQFLCIKFNISICMPVCAE